MESVIKGGFVLLARKTRESELMDKPPLFAKLWLHILLEANHSDRKLQRGQLFTTLSDLVEAGSYFSGYRREYPTKKQVRAALKWFKDEGMIEAKRSTRGLIITVVNYDLYQNPKNYKTTEDTRRVHGGHDGGHAGGHTGDRASSGLKGDTGHTGGHHGGNTEGTARAHDTQQWEQCNNEEEKNIPDASSASSGTPPDPATQLDQLFENPNVKTLIHQTIERIHLTRKSGKAAPSIISRFVRDLRQYEDWKVGTGLTRYLEGEYHLDGKGERYALGIVRNSTAKDWQQAVQTVQKPQGQAQPSNIEPRNYKEAKDAERRSRAMRLLQEEDYAKPENNQAGIGQADDSVPISGTG